MKRFLALLLSVLMLTALLPFAIWAEEQEDITAVEETEMPAAAAKEPSAAEEVISAPQPEQEPEKAEQPAAEQEKGPEEPVPEPLEDPGKLPEDEPVEIQEQPEEEPEEAAAEEPAGDEQEPAAPAEDILGEAAPAYPWAELEDEGFIAFVLAPENAEYLTALLKEADSEAYISFAARVEAIADEEARSEVNAYLLTLLPAEEPDEAEEIQQTEEPAVTELPEELPEAEPVITIQPIKDAAVEDGKAKFICEAAYTEKGAVLTYQWQQLDAGKEYPSALSRAEAWENIPGAAGSSLIITGIDEDSYASAYSAMLYRCIVFTNDDAEISTEAGILFDIVPVVPAAETEEEAAEEIKEEPVAEPDESEPEELADPEITEPAEPSDEMEPTEPAEPSDATEATEPAEPDADTEPAEEAGEEADEQADASEDEALEGEEPSVLLAGEPEDGGGEEGKDVPQPSIFTMAEQYTASSVKLKWNEIEGAKSYVVSYVLKGVKKKTVVKTPTATAKSLVKGEYTFTVAPCTDKYGKKAMGEEYTVTATVGDWSWAAAPKIKATQPDPLEPVVNITWTAAEGSDGFEISKSKKTVIGRYTDTFAVSAVVARGANYIYVRPYRIAEDGSYIYGSYSAAAKLTVKVNWMGTKPSVKVSQIDEDTVSLTWAENAYADGYYVYEYAAKKYTLIATVTEPECVLHDVTYGKHSYAVRAFRENSLGVKDEGTRSGAKSITTKVLWSQAPTLKIRQASNDSAVLTWTSKLQAPLYNVYGLVGKTYRLLATVDGTSYTTDPEEFPMLIGKTYKFKVRPVKEDIEGTASKIVSVGMIVGWKVAPVLSAQQTFDDQITLSWTVADDAQYYTIYRVVSKKNKKVIELAADLLEKDGKTYSYSIDGLAAGKYTYIVEPAIRSAKGTRTAGKKSASVTVTIGAYDHWIREGSTLIAYRGHDANLTLPEGITAIGAEAFAGNTSLVSINLNDAVTSVGAGAFAGCTNLETVTGTDALTTIGNGAFEDCGSLNFVFAENVENVAEDAFKGAVDADESWKAAHTLTLTDGLFGAVTLSWTEANTRVAFEIYEVEAANYRLIDIVTGNVRSYQTVASSGSHTFAIRAKCGQANGRPAYGEYGTATITVDAGSATVDKVVYSLQEDRTLAVTGYVGDESNVTIPQTIENYIVSTIGVSAFEGNTTLESIDLPDSIESIQEKAFSGCTKLRSMS